MGYTHIEQQGLARFGGTALYEHADPRKGFHPDWNTAIYVPSAFLPEFAGSAVAWLASARSVY